LFVKVIKRVNIKVPSAMEVTAMCVCLLTVQLWSATDSTKEEKIAGTAFVCIILSSSLLVKMSWCHLLAYISSMLGPI